jgi:hypothetical protein
MRVLKRLFSNTKCLNGRRSYKYLQEKAKTLVPEKSGLGTLELETLTGNLDVDGINRYELDFIEAADFTGDLLLKMQNDTEKLKSLHKEFEPKGDICIEFREDYTYDFSKPAPINSQTKVHVKVSSVVENGHQRHTLLLLAGKQYSPYTDTITLVDETNDSEKQNDAAFDRYTILENCSKQLQEMLKIAQVLLINIV